MHLSLVPRASWYIGNAYGLLYATIIIVGCALSPDNCLKVALSTIVIGAAAGYTPGGSSGANDPILPTKRGEDFVNDHVKLTGNVDMVNWPKVYSSRGYHYAHAVKFENQTLPFEFPKTVNEVKKAIASNGRIVTFTKLEKGYYASTALGEEDDKNVTKRDDGYNSVGWSFGEDDPNDGNPSTDTANGLAGTIADDITNQGWIEGCVSLNGPSSAPYMAGTVTLQHQGDPPAKNSRCGT